MERKKYFENLDGLRFIAFLMVFLAHSLGTTEPELVDQTVRTLVEFIRGACWLGVPFFFVLSGFLITYLLIVEQERRGKIALGNFYMRRFLRIWPLYFAIMVFGFVVFPIADAHFLGESRPSGASEWMYWTFLSNFDQISVGMPDAPAVGVSWSVAIEEQFYLFWPLVLLFIPSRFYLHLMVSLIGLSMVYRLGFEGHEKHTISSILDLAAGGALAVVYTERLRIHDRIRTMSKGWVAFVYLLGILLLFAHSHTEFSFRFLITLFMAFVIYEQNFCEHSLFKMSNFKRLSVWGTWTYGLYMLHSIALFLVDAFFERMTDWAIEATLRDYLVLPLVAFMISLIVARLSYSYFEKPFLNLKKRFAS